MFENMTSVSVPKSRGTKIPGSRYFEATCSLKTGLAFCTAPYTSPECSWQPDAQRCPGVRPAELLLSRTASAVICSMSAESLGAA